MIMYPSSESKTPSTLPSWTCITLSLLAAGGYFFYFLPLNREDALNRDQKRKALAELIAQYGRDEVIPDRFVIRAQEDLSILADPSFAGTFPQDLRDGYRALQDIPHPLETLAAGPALKRLTLALVPHHWLILLLSAFGLISLGFLFEHIYDRQVLPALIVLVTAIWVLFEPYMPASIWPSPLFAWSNTAAVLLLLIWILNFRASVTMTLAGWFFKTFSYRIELPTFVFPLFFFATFILVNMHLSEYGAHYNHGTLAVYLIIAGLLALVVWILPTREQRDEQLPETAVNLNLAKAEYLFANNQNHEGMVLLRQLLEDPPEVPQLRRIAKLAWEHHEAGLAEQAFNIALRETIKGGDFYEILNLLEEALFRDVTVPGAILLRIIEQGITKYQVSDIRKLLPYVRDQGDVAPEKAREIHEVLIEKLCQSSSADKPFLYEIKIWLEAHHPDSVGLEKLNQYFEKFSSQAGVIDNYSGTALIHRYIHIELLEVTANHARLRIEGQKEQLVPWTAVMGFHGCHLTTGQRGYLGVLLIRFKRKIFACLFSEKEIGIKNATGQPVNFEVVWNQLQVLGPEEMPQIPIESFSHLPNSVEYRKELQAFANRHIR